MIQEGRRSASRQEGTGRSSWEPDDGGMRWAGGNLSVFQHKLCDRKITHSKPPFWYILCVLEIQTGIGVCSQKIQAEVLKPGDGNSVCCSNQINSRSLGLVFIQGDWCPDKKRGRHRPGEKAMWKKTDQNDSSTCQGAPRTAGHHQEPGRAQVRIIPCVLEEAWCCCHLDFQLLPSGGRRALVPSFSGPQFVALCVLHPWETSPVRMTSLTQECWASVGRLRRSTEALLWGEAMSLAPCMTWRAPENRGFPAKVVVGPLQDPLQHVLKKVCFAWQCVTSAFCLQPSDSSHSMLGPQIPHLTDLDLHLF